MVNIQQLLTIIDDKVLLTIHCLRVMKLEKKKKLLQQTLTKKVTCKTKNFYILLTF